MAHAATITVGTILMIAWLVVFGYLIQLTRRLMLDRYEVMTFVFFPAKLAVAIAVILAALLEGVVAGQWWFYTIPTPNVAIVTTVLVHGFLKPIAVFNICFLLYTNLSELIRVPQQMLSSSESVVSGSRNDSNSLASPQPSARSRQLDTPRERESRDEGSDYGGDETAPALRRRGVGQSASTATPPLGPQQPRDADFPDLRRGSREDMVLDDSFAGDALGDTFQKLPIAGGSGGGAVVPPVPIARMHGGAYEVPVESPREESAAAAGLSLWFLPARQQLTRARSRPWVVSVIFWLLLHIIFAIVQGETTPKNPYQNCGRIDESIQGFSYDLSSCYVELSTGHTKFVLPRVFDVLQFLFYLVVLVMWTWLGYHHGRRLLQRKAREKFQKSFVFVIFLLCGSALIRFLLFFPFGRGGWSHAFLLALQAITDGVLYVHWLQRIVGLTEPKNKVKIMAASGL